MEGEGTVMQADLRINSIKMKEIAKHGLCSVHGWHHGVLCHKIE